MSNGDYFDEKMRRGDRSKEARRISPPLKLLLKSPKLRGSTAPKSAHLHRGREQRARVVAGCSTAEIVDEVEEVAVPPAQVRLTLQPS